MEQVCVGHLQSGLARHKNSGRKPHEAGETYAPSRQDFERPAPAILFVFPPTKSWFFALGVAPEDESAAGSHITSHGGPKSASERTEELVVLVADDLLTPIDYQLKPVEHSEVVLARTPR